jgi:hypothetical protein
VDLKKIGLMVFALFGLIGLLESLNAAALECADFQDNFIWSSGYSITEDSISYYKWNVGNDCPGSNCFMQGIKVYVRVTDYDVDGNVSGYVQISNADETNCEDASKAEYSKYAAYKIATKNEELVYAWDCGTQSNNVCSLTAADEYSDDESCFSVKVWAKKQALVDVVKINYTWCWTKSVDDKKDGGDGVIASWGYFVLIVVIVTILTFTILRRKHGF